MASDMVSLERWNEELQRQNTTREATLYLATHEIQSLKHQLSSNDDMTSALQCRIRDMEHNEKSNNDTSHQHESDLQAKLRCDCY
jgi:CII-binding regulator of phage lambda lysogenization HflD